MSHLPTLGFQVYQVNRYSLSSFIPFTYYYWLAGIHFTLVSYTSIRVSNRFTPKRATIVSQNCSLTMLVGIATNYDAYSETVGRLSQSEFQRQIAIEELISTEESYMEDMVVVTEVIFPVIKAFCWHFMILNG